jgi:hypothetical protein
VIVTVKSVVGLNGVLAMFNVVMVIKSSPAQFPFSLSVSVWLVLLLRKLDTASSIVPTVFWVPWNMDLVVQLAQTYPVKQVFAKFLAAISLL